MRAAGTLWIVRQGDSLRTPVALCIADNFFSRALGLLAHAHLADDKALWIRPCAGIHTWFMRFSIDVLFLNKDNQVLGIAENIRPFRMAFAPRGTCSVIELSAGNAMRSGIRVGDIIALAMASADNKNY